jgi:hypothetical protein
MQQSRTMPGVAASHPLQPTSWLRRLRVARCGSVLVTASLGASALAAGYCVHTLTPFSNPRSNDGDKTLYASFAMFQTQSQNNSWHQTFKAQALEAYSDDAVIYSSSASSALRMCTRRWGCIECASTASDQCANLNRNSALNIFRYDRCLRCESSTVSDVRAGSPAPPMPSMQPSYYSPPNA